MERMEGMMGTAQESKAESKVSPWIQDFYDRVRAVVQKGRTVESITEQERGQIQQLLVYECAQLATLVGTLACSMAVMTRGSAITYVNLIAGEASVVAEKCEDHLDQAGLGQR